jgi:DNA-binding NarL/FixJ family response regulator
VIGVAVISASPMAGARLEALVAASPGLRLARAPFPTPTVAGDGPRARAEPDVLLLDPGPRAVEAVFRMRSRAGHVSPVVVLGDDDLVPAAFPRLLRAGVRAVMPRDASAHEIAACIAAVAAGLVVLHPSALPFSRTVRRKARGVPAAVATAPLTPRELEVLAMMAEGMGNRAIAQRLAISTHTVKFHVAAILDKLNARSRTQAVTVGLRLGVLMV